MKQIKVRYERSITRVPVKVRSGVATTLAAGAVTLGALLILATVLTIVAIAMYYVVLSGVIGTPMPEDSSAPVTSQEIKQAELEGAIEKTYDPQQAGRNQ